MQYLEHSLTLPFLEVGMKTDLFPSPVALLSFPNAGILSAAL